MSSIFVCNLGAISKLLSQSSSARSLRNKWREPNSVHYPTNNLTIICDSSPSPTFQNQRLNSKDAGTDPRIQPFRTRFIILVERYNWSFYRRNRETLSRPTTNLHLRIRISKYRSRTTKVRHRLYLYSVIVYIPPITVRYDPPRRAGCCRFSTYT